MRPIWLVDETIGTGNGREWAQMDGNGRMQCAPTGAGSRTGFVDETIGGWEWAYAMRPNGCDGVSSTKPVEPLEPVNGREWVRRRNGLVNLPLWGRIACAHSHPPMVSSTNELGACNAPPQMPGAGWCCQNNGVEHAPNAARWSTKRVEWEWAEMGACNAPPQNARCRFGDTVSSTKRARRRNGLVNLPLWGRIACAHSHPFPCHPFRRPTCGVGRMQWAHAMRPYNMTPTKPPFLPARGIGRIQCAWTHEQPIS